MNKLCIGITFTLAMFVLAACGNNGGDGGSGDDTPDSATMAAARTSCSDVCAAQSASETANDCAALTEMECNQLCDARVAVGTCLTEFTALNECKLTGEFSCGFVSAESDADCRNAQVALDSCSMDDTSACAGANERGVCPAVACACPDGDTSISAFDDSGDRCTCVTEETCQEFCF